MTITLKARTAAIIAALFCILAGLAIGQLTQAKSARAGGAPQLNSVVQKLGAVNGKLGTISKQLGTISTQLGGSSLTSISDQVGQIRDNLGGGSILSIDYRLKQIESSSTGTCRAVKGIGC